ncbi:hypothetical protein RRG08_057029 [Elysia crispata]|uniref:Uncharacterized protein n=1 Tax=Elysia crispata TaxID=231223 RepID=A0AAE1DAR0_9GAST|nr:hypothetical protein RRG08_057029 [Elysia crispata]
MELTSGIENHTPFTHEKYRGGFDPVCLSNWVAEVPVYLSSRTKSRKISVHKFQPRRIRWMAPLVMSRHVHLLRVKALPRQLGTALRPDTLASSGDGEIRSLVKSVPSECKISHD